MKLGILKDKVNGLLSLAKQRIFVSSKVEREIVDNFHKLYYQANEWGKGMKGTTWEGIRTQKCPLDLWIYQEMIWKLKPDIIVETGTLFGGSALYMARVLDSLGKGRIISVDIEKRETPSHERITYLNGSSVSEEIVNSVKSHIYKGDKVLVILDSDHSRNHVLTELEIYSEFVSLGSYLIVEDTNINGHPVEPNYGAGPYEAVMDFLKTNKNFKIDKSKERFMMTLNPCGYLKRIS